MSVLIQRGANPSIALGTPLTDYSRRGSRKLQVENLMDSGCSTDADVNFRSMTDGPMPL